MLTIANRIHTYLYSTNCTPDRHGSIHTWRCRRAPRPDPHSSQWCSQSYRRQLGAFAVRGAAPHTPRHRHHSRLHSADDGHRQYQLERKRRLKRLARQPSFARPWKMSPCLKLVPEMFL